MKKSKYISMRFKVQRLVLIVAIAAMLLDSAVAVAALLWMKNKAVNMADTLGSYASQEGEEAILSQSEQSAVDLVSGKALLAQGSLNEYLSFAQAIKLCAENLYAHKDVYEPVDMVPRSQYKNGVPTMWLALQDKTVRYEDFNDKIGFLGNIKPILSSIYEENNDIIANVYIGVEGAGYCIGYGSTPEDIPEYFNYPERSWYKETKAANHTIFTDAYLDAFGYGLLVTCTMPFNDENGNFAGVISMDIPLDALNDKVMGVNLGENSYVLILDEHGNIIASPKIDKNSDDFDNILTNKNSPAHEAADILMSGKTGITQTSEGIYYAYAPIELTGWTAVIHYESAEITAPMMAIHNDINNRTNDSQDEMRALVLNVIIAFTSIIVFMSLLVMFVSKMFANRITRPLLLMTETVKDVHYIDGPDSKLIVDTKDEISDLADAFNGLKDAINKYVMDLTTLTAEKERISAELDIATRIQADMLPSIFPYLPEREEFDLFASMNPAKKVGGDFYDFFMVDSDHLAIVMADVSGKGIPAALFMVIAKTLIKNTAQQKLSAHEILESVNKQLYENNKEEMFVTAWIGILKISTGVLYCANAGHEFPAIRRKGGKFELLKNKHGFVLAGLEQSKYSEYEIQLEPGDNVFVYTDGIPEAINVDEEMFGTDRMLEALNKSTSDCRNILDTVRAELDQFVGKANQFDDLTMLALIYRGKK